MFELLIECLINWFNAWSTDEIIDWFIDWMVEKFLNWLIDRILD